ncbi:unnamed protein product [Phytomonas sp. Hart1]|nr:unnamed protein product [Phytomonas sp. Hart1]|eukprot:CCW69413.1 unnamed protein product [Phytomonas sp. isolate Hart1]
MLWLSKCMFGVLFSPFSLPLPPPSLPLPLFFFLSPLDFSNLGDSGSVGILVTPFQWIFLGCSYELLKFKSI